MLHESRLFHTLTSTPIGQGARRVDQQSTLVRHMHIYACACANHKSKSQVPVSPAARLTSVTSSLCFKVCQLRQPRRCRTGLQTATLATVRVPPSTPHQPIPNTAPSKKHSLKKHKHSDARVLFTARPVHQVQYSSQHTHTHTPCLLFHAQVVHKLTRLFHRQLLEEQHHRPC